MVLLYRGPIEWFSGSVLEGLCRVVWFGILFPTSSTLLPCLWSFPMKLEWCEKGYPSHSGGGGEWGTE